jgi:hypothetical protein
VVHNRTCGVDLLDQWHLLQNTAQIRFPPAFRVPDVCFFRTLVESSVGQWQDGYGEIHDRFWSESLAHSLHTDRHATSRNSQSNDPGLADAGSAYRLAKGSALPRTRQISRTMPAYTT